jgi:hypothetical protein
MAARDIKLRQGVACLRFHTTKTRNNTCTEAVESATTTATKDALAAAKARGKRLGGDRGNLPAVAKDGAKASVAARIKKADSRASDLAPIIKELKASGAVSLRQIIAGLNAKGIKTARGGEWSAVQVQRIMERGEIAVQQGNGHEAFS